jgi:hypothetical protein
LKAEELACHNGTESKGAKSKKEPGQEGKE